MELLYLSPSTESFLDYEDINPSIHVMVKHQSIPDLDRDDSIYSDWPEVLAILSNFVNISYESCQVYPNDDISHPPPLLSNRDHWITLGWGIETTQMYILYRVAGISLKKMTCIVTWVGVMTHDIPWVPIDDMPPRHCFHEVHQQHLGAKEIIVGLGWCGRKQHPPNEKEYAWKLRTYLFL